MNLSNFAYSAFLLTASLGVYTFLVSSKDAETRAGCSALCALRPAYADHTRRVPSFKLRSLDGTMVEMSSFRGKTVVLNFWTKTCQPCLEEMPSLAELAELWRSDPTKAVLTISTDPTPADARVTLQAVLGKDPPFMVLLDPDAEVVSNAFGTHLFPETWLIDPDGVIRLRVDGALDWSNPLVQDVAQRAGSHSSCPLSFRQGKVTSHPNVCED